MNDIVLNEGTFDADGNYSDGTAVEWTPIGTYEAPYTGTFDGAGHTIRGLYTNSSDDYQGLFAKLENATVKALTVTGYIEGYDYVGAIAGEAIGTTSISSCRRECTIKGDDNIGGIVGESYDSVVIRDCYNAGEIRGDGDISGIVGDANDNTIIENCHNTGAITSDDDDIGGIAGVIYDNVIVRNCSNTGTVSGDDDIGGIVGDINDSGVVERCYNTGEVSGDDDIGGIAGETPEAGGIQDCYNLGKVTGNSHTGGVAGHHRGEMESCYNMGTVSATGGESKYGAIAGYVYGDDYDDEHYGGKIKNCYYLNGTAEKGIGANDNTSESEVVAPTAYDAADFANGTVLNLLIANRTGDENPWDTEGCGKYYSDEAATKEITKDATIIAKLTEKPADTKPTDTKSSGTKTSHSKSTASSPKTNGKSPETGDTNVISLWLVLLLLSGGAAFGAVIGSRKKYNK